MPVSLLTIELLGPPQIGLSGRPLDVRVRKELALLAYLAVEQQHGHSRETLVGLLWPDEPEEAARNNLRVVLAGLRRLLGAAGGQFVQADRQRVQLVPGGDCTLDVLTFRRLLDEVRAHAHVADERCDTCIAWLSEAAALYRGDFLQGFSLPDSAPFEEWVAVVREQLHQGQLDALHSLAVACEQCGDYSAQVAYGRQQLALEPWRESAHAQVMRGLWASGQRGAALEQYEACRRILDAELGLHPAPELTALYEQLRTGERDRPLTRQPEQAAAHLPQLPQLPIAPAALLGRANDVAAVARLLADPTCRLVTVYGPGGVGKTRLALHLAAMLRDTFRDGVAFVSLASVSEPALVSAAIAQALELREQVDQPVLATLTRALRNRHMLLVLDNFEQVLAASPLVADLLQSAPQLSVLVTSRAVLHLSAERSFALAPLALPDPDEHSIEQLAQSPAVQLFVERVQAVKPGFHLSAEDGATVAAICARLDGLPLAIELAAARARMFTFPALLARLGNSLQLLTGGSRDLPARQQTLRAAIAWSYVLLDPNEQALLRWMSVCVGGWSLEAAEVIATNMQGDEHPLFHDPSFVLNGLESLIDQSLVQQHGHSAGTVRFRMLETIREYAFEQLAQHETASVVQHHHAAYYVALAEEISNHRSDWIDRLALEYDNLRAALTYCQMATSSGEGAAAVELGMRLCGALTYFWFKRGVWSEGRMWLGWALERTARVRPTQAQAHALAGMGEFAWHQSDFAAGYTLLNKSLALFRDLGDSKGYGRTQHSLGLVYREQGDVEHAAALLTESLALFREVGDQEGQAGALCSLGEVAILKGDAAQADVLLADSLARFRGQNVQMGVAWVTNHLGHLALLQADYDRAGTLQRESLAYFRAHDEQLGQAWALHGLGAAVLAQGHAAQAAAHFAESLTIFQQLADKHGVAWCLEGLAGTAWLGEQPERAARLWGAEAALRHALGTRSAPAMSRLSEHLQAATRARLGSEAFAGVWQQGAALSLDQAITEALEQASAFARPVSAAQSHGEGNNLPVELTSFVGRDEQIAGVCRALDGARLVTLAGAGGSGKTRLALRVAETLAASYRDGVWLVELAALNDPAFVPQAVAAALGVREATGQPLQEVLARTLAAKQLLLLLDNCEHLLDACRLLVEQLLRACPKLTVLTTSREVFQIAGEHVWPVPGLAVPAAELVAPTELMSHDSVRLFVERASASNPTFALNASNASAVAQLCRRLDGIPLALELAAARVRHLTVQEIAARLDDRFALLTAGDPTAVPRQRTLRAAIDWSCDLLLADEQALFRLLAVFAGGWTLESAEAVCAVEHGDQQVATLELLSQLVDKSLVIVEQQGSTARYRMLETIRAYGHERLAEADELTMVRERHLDYFVHLAEQAEQQLFAAEQADWLNLLTVEHDNLRAAISNAIERANAPAALRLVTALRSFWYTRGHYDEGRRRTIQVLSMPAAQARTHVRAAALNAAAALLWAGGDADAALPLLNEALAIGRELGDPWNTGWALLHQGTIAHRQGDHTSARSLLEDGLVSCRAAGPAGQRGVGWGLSFLGDLAFDSGDLERAHACFIESVDLLRKLSDYGLLAYPLRRLAHLAYGEGDFAAAKALCTESLRLNRAIDDRLAVVACLAAHAAIAAAEGQAASGERRLEHLRHAANVCGVTAAQLEAIGAPLWPADVAAIERVAATVEDQLGAAAFADALAAGRAMSVEQLLARAAEPAADSSAPPTLPILNLPAPLTPCIGREAELAELVALLQKPEVRLVTLVGVGGMGKTRLAQELGRASITAFADGVCFVPLAPLAAASAIAPAILAELDEQPGSGDPREALLHILRAKRLLLILDNFEHLLGGTAIVSDILQAAPLVTVIATSRERLNVRGEHQHLLHGLAFAPSASLAEAADAPAVRLFVEFAQRVQASFVVNSANLGAVLRICQLVEGMPLGIELAATWIETMSPGEIAAEIAQNADFLAAEWRDLPERQRSMRAVFDWSWQLLSDAERQVFKQLAIFRGGLTRQAAQAVAGASLILLTSLVRKSLLRWGQGHGGVGRYELHELLRQFAAEQLDALPDERAAVEARHCQFYLSYVAERERHLARGDPGQASDEMRSELDNIRQAWISAATHARIEDLGRAAYGLWQFYTLVGPRSEAAQMFRQVVEHGHTPLDHIAGDEQVLQNRRRALSTVLAIHALLLVIDGKNDLAAAAAQQAIGLGRASGGVDGEILGCLALGQTLQYSGQFLEARAMFEQTVQLCHDYQAGHGTSELVCDAEWQAYIWLQGIATLFGDYASARAYVLQSLRICQTLGKRNGELICLFNLAQTAFFSGDHSIALQEYEQTLGLARALGNRHREAWVYIDVGRIMYVQGAYTRAHVLAEQGLALARELDEVYLQIIALATLGRLHSSMGDAIGAGTWLEQLAQLMGTERLLPESTVEGLLALAIHAASVGDHQRALSYAEQGCQIVQENVIGHIRAHALIMMGHALVGVDRLTDARTMYQQAITYCDELVDVPLATEPRAGLAQIALRQGDLVQAQRLVEPMLAVLAEQPQAGWNTPFDVYLTCYRVLEEHRDPRAATVLQTGQRLLRAYADRIADDALRQSFLKNVATHRALLSSKLMMQRP